MYSVEISNNYVYPTWILNVLFIEFSILLHIFKFKIKSPSKKLSPGAIAGIVIAVILLVVVLIAVVVMVMKRRAQSDDRRPLTA